MELKFSTAVLHQYWSCLVSPNSKQIQNFGREIVILIPFYCLANIGNHINEFILFYPLAIPPQTYSKLCADFDLGLKVGKTISYIVSSLISNMVHCYHSCFWKNKNNDNQLLYINDHPKESTGF